MTSNEILQADLLDIVFDHRNKQYGAYELRKAYHQRLGVALGSSISSFLLLVLFISAHSGDSWKQAQAIPPPDVEVSILKVPSVQPPTPQPPAPQVHRATKPVAQQQLVNRIEIKPDMVAKNLVPDLSVFDHADISNVNVQGPPATGTAQAPAALSPGSAPTVQPADNSPVTGSVEKEPEFPGGVRAWLNYLSRNLRTPEELQSGEKRTVLIRFEVSKDGSVQGFEVVQSGGTDFDNEVIRVLKKMPKWKPAIQNSHSVARYFTQPVTFMAEGE